MYVPEEWDTDPERRGKAKMPDEIGQREKWRLALDIIDGLRGWGLQRKVVQAEAATARSPRFGRAWKTRVRLRRPGQGPTSAHPAHLGPRHPRLPGRGRPPKARYSQDA